MNTVPLGKTELNVSKLSFGSNVLGWTVTESESFSLLDSLLDNGINFIDTADVYSAWVDANSGGESERILGKWLARSGKRQQIILATKCGLWHDYPGLSAENIRRSVEASLRRLRTDYIDVYFAHRDDPGTALEETMTTLSQLVDEGKVRVLGGSNYSADRLVQALTTSHKLSLPSFDVLQPQYNLCDRNEYESGLEAIAEKYQLGVVPYFSLASGFLTGKYKNADDITGRAREHRLRNYSNDRGFAIVDALNKVALSVSSTPAAVALAWLISRPSITAPIVSATSEVQLEQLTASLKIQLSADDLQFLDHSSQYSDDMNI